MAARRGHGEGAVYQRGDGRWVGSLNLGWQDGQRRRKSVYGRTQKEAWEKLDAIRQTVQKGLPPPSERLKLSAYIEGWLEGVVRFSVRPSTHVRYRDLLRLHVIPTLGHLPLTRIQRDDLRRLYAGKQEQGLAPRTVGHIHRVLHAAIEDAVHGGHVGRNICDTVRPPKVIAAEMKTLSPDQARALLAESEHDPLHALYVLALTTGMRQSELLGLRWQDVDLAAGSLAVRHTIRWVSGLGSIEGEPKSDSSRRQITLTPVAIAALRRHKVEQAEKRLKALAWDDHDLVFANEIGRPVQATNLVRRSFHPLLERAGLPRVRFHDLRHTCATLLLGQNVNVKIVSEMLGHSKIAVTLDLYQHVTPGMQAEAAAKMQAILG